MSSNSDDEFSPKESADKSDNEEFLNKKTGEYVPQMVLKTLLFIAIAMGFAIGFIIVAAVTSGAMCMFQMMTALTADPTSAGDNLTDDIRSQFTQCTKTSMTSPVPIVLGIIGGAVAAYPSYKLIQGLSGGNYIRSLI